MSRSVALFTVVVVAAAVAVSSVWAAAPPCEQITQMISPCIGYLSGQSPSPAGPCCVGITALNNTAATHGDRVSICGCLKSLAPRFPGVDFTRASALPSECGVNLNTTIAPTIDCNTVA